MLRPPAELALLTRLSQILGRHLNQSDIDFIHILKRDDVIEFVLNYLAEYY